MVTKHWIAVATCLCAVLITPAYAELKPMKADKAKVRAWNEFADALFDVHSKLIENRKIRTSEEYGGYYQMPKFYLETSYFDAENGRLLSRIQRETESPDKIHQIEIFIYDDKGKISRDYLAGYLPVHRNAPIYTFINFHHAQDNLHGYRQFDASGNRIYEQCKDTKDNDNILLSLEGIDINNGPYAKKEVTEGELYTKCFAGLPLQAGDYLDPHVEIPGWVSSSGVTTVVTVEEMRKQIDLLTKAAIKDRNNAMIYVQRGNIHLQLLEFDQAVDDFSTAIRIDDSVDEAWFGRGMALGRSGFIEKGIADLDVYIKRNPRDSRAFTKRGVRYLWLGNETKAEMDLRQALILNPNNAEAHDDLGVIHARRGDYQNALQHFKDTVRLDPTYQKGFHNLAMTYFFMKHHPKALENINQALVLQTDSRNSLLLKAEILEAMGNTAEAKAVMEKAEFLPDGEWSEVLNVK